MRLIITITLVSLLFATASVSHSSKNNVVDNKSAQKETYDAHRAYTRYHFEDEEMDFAFQWLLGSIPNGGAEIGEAFYVAGNIEDGNPASWQAEWEKMAERKEARAKEAIKNGHKITASECYVKAANYYRTALVSMLPDNPKFNEIAKRIRPCMVEAGKLFTPPMTYFEVPFEKIVLPGYYRPVKKDGKPRRTLLMIGGGETFMEDNVVYIEPQTIKRGYNFITVDIPGQGMLPAEGQFFRKDTETQMKAILDVILKFPEVDPEKIAVYGISNGGYFVPRAACFEKRIKALAVSSAVVDNYLMFKQMPFAKDTQEQIDKWPAFKKAVTSAVAWRWGLDPEDVKGQVEQTKDFQFDPSKVTCPVLDIVGAGEYANEETERQQKEFMDNVGTKNKKLVITPENEGASSHCIGENRTLMAEILFDWLDEVFKEKKINNLKMPPLNTTLMGVVKGSLDYYGLEYTTPETFGKSGHAFLINIHEQLCPSGPYCWNREPASILIQNLGIEMNDLGFFSPENNKEERKAVELKLREALDSKNPCSLLNMENQLITGYDSTGFLTEQPWPQNKEFPPPRLTFENWKELGEEIHINFYTIAKCEPADEKTAVLASLDYAVDLFRYPKKHSSKNYGVGPDAYNNWINAVEKYGSTHGNWWNATVWSECRKMASLYFEEIGKKYPQTSDIASKLSKNYEEISSALSKVSNKEMPSEEKTEILKETLKKEEASINLVSELISKLREK